MKRIMQMIYLTFYLQDKVCLHTEQPIQNIRTLIRINIMQTGTVNRFNKIKGYGFITADDSNDEVFVHFSEIQSAGYKELIKGQRVRYVLIHGERGDYAAKVEII